MALDPQLLEILACPEDKGPLLYFEDEDALYNPRLKRRYAIQDDIPIMLIDEAETVDDAEHERLVAKAEAEGITADLRGLSADVRASSTRSACSTWPPRCPSRSAAAAVARRRGRRAARARRHRERRRARHGRQRHRRRRPGRRRRRRSCRCRSPWSKGYEAPSFVGEGTLCFAISFSGDTEETVEAAQAAAAAGARMVVLSTGGELGRAGAGRGARRTSSLPDVPDAARRDRRRSASRRWSCSSASGCSPAPPSASPTPSTSCSAGATSSSSTAARPSGLAREIGRTMPDRLRRRRPRRAWPPTAGSARSTRTPRRPRSAAALPEMGHNEICGWGQHGDITRQVITVVRLRHDFEHPQVARRFELTYEIIDEVVHAVLDVEAEGEGALAQLLDLVHPGRLREPPPGRRGRRRPRARSRCSST